MIATRRRQQLGGGRADERWMTLGGRLGQGIRHPLRIRRGGRGTVARQIAVATQGGGDGVTGNHRPVRGDHDPRVEGSDPVDGRVPHPGFDLFDPRSDPKGRPYQARLPLIRVEFGSCNDAAGEAGSERVSRAVEAATWIVEAACGRGVEDRRPEGAHGTPCHEPVFAVVHPSTA